MADATLAIPGVRYAATVPDTLDLTQRAELALHSIASNIDPARMTMYGLIHFCCKRPHLSHWASAETLLDPKFAESFFLMRLMTGSEKFTDLEAAYRQAILSRVDSDLYWDRVNPSRPWRNSYAPAFYGQGKDEDFCTLPGTGRLVRTLMIWGEMQDNPLWSGMARELIGGLRRIAICRDDYCYYPEKGGWGEPCAYPRSGWLNTDEARSETEGGEGSVICMHGHQLYAAANWHARTGDERALDLARRLARFCMQGRFWGGVADPAGNRKGLPGHIAPMLPDPPFMAGHEQGHWYSHFHARAIALRGLLEYGRLLGDERAMEFVRRSYEFTLGQGIARMGWINCYPGALNQVEGCALGDLTALGIRLTDAGLGDYFDDVEAVVRNQLVEQQLLSTELLERVAAQYQTPCPCENTDQPGKLLYDTVIARSIGSFAGTALPTAIPNPWVMHCCTSNATQGLYYAWEASLREQTDTAQVNLLLNRAGRLVDVDSYLPYEGKVVIGNKSARRVRVRMPWYVPRSTIRASVAGQPRRLDWVGNYLHFDALKPGENLTLTFEVRETTACYTVNAHTPQEQVYRCVFRGGTLVDISPRDQASSGYPLYVRLHMRAMAAPMKQVRRFLPERVVRGW